MWQCTSRFLQTHAGPEIDSIEGLDVALRSTVGQFRISTRKLPQADMSTKGTKAPPMAFIDTCSVPASIVV